MHVGLWRLRTIHWEVLCEQKKLAGDSVSGASLGAFSWSLWILCFPVIVFREFISLRFFLDQMKKFSVCWHLCACVVRTLQELELWTGSTDKERSSDEQHAHHNYSNFCLLLESSQEFSEDYSGRDQRFYVYWSLQNWAPSSSEILTLTQQCRHTFAVSLTTEVETIPPSSNSTCLHCINTISWHSRSAQFS